MRDLRCCIVTVVVLASIGLKQAHAQAAPASAIHGTIDETLSTTYITPRGLMESDSGVSAYTTVSLNTSIYASDEAFAKDVSIHGGALFNLYSRQSIFNEGLFREFDWWAGTNLTLQDGVDLGVEYSQFVSPRGVYSTDNNIEFSALLPPIALAKALTVTPYGKLFWNVSGASTVVTGKENEFDVELGAKAALDLNRYSIPLMVTIPTWVTVGPSGFWGGSSNFGVFTTGLTATTPLSFIPSRYGAWYADAGVQYYHLLNDQLLVAQQEIGVHPQRDIVTGSIGIGFGF